MKLFTFNEAVSEHASLCPDPVAAGTLEIVFEGTCHVLCYGPNFIVSFLYTQR